MPELNHLIKRVSNHVVIYPYKEVKEDVWPSYMDEAGKWVKYDEGWREVGFRLPYPTVARLNQLQDLMRGIEIEDRSFKLVGGDSKRAAKFITYNLLQGVEGITDQGEPVIYDKKIKEWLYNEFCKSSFLLSHFRSTYEELAGKVIKEEKDEEENFTEKSTPSSDGSSLGHQSEQSPESLDD